MKLKQIESVIFAEKWSRLIDWYVEVLGFEIEMRVETDYHYCVLKHTDGAQLGIADAKEMSVDPRNRPNNSVLLQFQVPDVKALLAHISEQGGSTTFGPSFDKQDEFWFGGFNDLEGNPFWVVDENCP